MPNAWDYFNGDPKFRDAQRQGYDPTDPAQRKLSAQQTFNEAHWGKDQGTDKYGWGGGRYYGPKSVGSFEGGAGTEFGQRMRLAAQQEQAPVNMDVRGMQPYLDRSNQSYGQQQNALQYMKDQAAGRGPSVAAIQGQAGQDQALRGMMGHRGGPMLPNAGAGLYGAANAGAAARAGEVGRGQQGFMGAAGQMRGQTLEERGQNLANAAKYKDVGLSSQQQDLERELALQKLALQGYTYDQSQQNAMADLQLGLQGDEMQRNQQFLNAGLNAGAGAFSAAGSYFGNSPGGGGGGGGREQYRGSGGSWGAPGSEDWYRTGGK